MKIGLRKLVYLVIAVSIVGMVVYGFLPKPIEVDTATVALGSLMVTVDEDGRTRIREKYVVSAPLAGRLLRIDMEPGDQVKVKNTLLATIQPADPQFLDARALAQAEARAKAAEAALKKADPSLQAARVALEHSENELARQKEMLKTNASSKEKVDLAKMVFQSRSEEYRSAKFAQEIASYELQLAQAALLRTRTRDDENVQTESQFEMHSPITGNVLRVFQESSAIVQAGTPLLELGDPQDLEIEIDVLSSDAVKIRPGDRVIVEHWGGDEPLDGRVKLVEPAAFTKISALGVEEQRVWVIVDITNPPEERATLGDGFRIEGRIVTWSGDQVLQVPTSALFRDNQQNWVVFRSLNGRAVQTGIEIGRSNGLQAQVLDGLTENDTVIIHPSDQVADGVQVVGR